MTPSPLTGREHILTPLLVNTVTAVSGWWWTVYGVRATHQCDHDVLTSYSTEQAMAKAAYFPLTWTNFVPHLIFRDGGHQLRLHLYLDSFLFLILFPGSPFWEPPPNHLLPGCPLWTLRLWKPTQRCPESRYHGYAYTCVPIQRSSYFNSISMVDPVSKGRNRNNWNSGNRRKGWHHVLDEPKKCDEPWSAQTSPRKVKFVSLACTQSSRQVHCCQTPSLYYS